MTNRRVKGMDTVLRALDREIDGVKNRTQAGVHKVAFRISEDAGKLVPKEYGDLARSRYVQKSPTKRGVFEVGFSANYAVYVHENHNPKWAGKPRKSGIGVYWGPKGEPRFLYKAVVKAKDYAMAMIANVTKRK